MNALSVAAKRHGRWILWLTLVFTLQLALIFWLSDSSTPQVRKSDPAPTLRLAGRGSSELLALSDPTLFALPHFQGFSGKAWIKGSPVQKHSFEWTEEPRWLTINQNEFPRAPTPEPLTDSFQTFQIVSSLELEPAPASIPSTSLLRQRSELKLEGGLTFQGMRNIPELPSWPYTENFTNTVIGVMVNSAGLVISPTLLSRSGLKDADDYALRTAKQLRFRGKEPADLGKGGVSHSDFVWGELIFQWRALPATNTTNQTGTPPK